MRLRSILLENGLFDDVEFADEPEFHFRSPDDIWGYGTTFIFGGNQAKLYLDKEPFRLTHNDMLDEIGDELFANTKFEEHWENHGINDKMHALAQEIAILGRVRDDKSFVSIWNRDPKLVDELYGHALKALGKKGLVDQGTRVYAPTLTKYYYVSDYIDVTGKQLSPEQEKQLEAMRQMHLARGDEKKSLMKQAGLKTLPGKRHPMATAMQKVGKSSPGQKWWTASEGRHR